MFARPAVPAIHLSRRPERCDMTVDDPDTPEDAAEPDDPDDGWRFGLDEVDENGIVVPDEGPIEPESVDLENALFVGVGVLGTLLVFVAATL